MTIKPSEMKSNKIAFLLITIVSLASCKKSFLDHPSANNPTLDTYYNTADQVRKATGYLYNSVWYDYQDKAFHAIGETLGGNMLTETGANYGSGSYNLFTVLSTDPLVLSSWQSLYKVAGNATVLANTFAQKKSGSGEVGYLNEGIAEARFMRGYAYFTIARVFGDVPIVDDPVALAGSGDYSVPRYFQKDVLRFALEDLKYASQNLPAAPSEKGRVSRYSALGMMAKLYLYRKDYDSAKAAAAQVIASNQYDLYPNYQEMFTSSKVNNNIESLFALQWIAAGGYGFANPIQVYSAPSTLLKPVVGTGYSAVYPTLDLLRSYDPNDKRRQWSVMEHGFTRADWKNANFPNGFKYDTTGTTYEDATHLRNGTRSNALKYVVGTGTNGEALSSNGSSDICTYILRFADVLLIYAEATLGNSASTSDASALAAFNRVHNRGGNFNNVAVTSITKALILKERRAEFAFEGDWWFDVQRQGFAAAQQIINAQERGTFNGDGTVNHAAATLTNANQLFLPIPQSETVSDPKLNQPAVAYYK
jgi:starch-binding outer membrane protein, SusD/RagB family